MDVESAQTFTCEEFHVTMSAAGAAEFCKKRLAAGLCIDCRQRRTRRITMGTSKCNEPGCKKKKLKGGLCWACYKKRHGVVPYPSGEKKAAPSKPGRAAKDAASAVASPKARPVSAANGSYVLTVDFERYPNLHERLEELAAEQYRTPDMQLLYMLDETFNRLEGKMLPGK